MPQDQTPIYDIIMYMDPDRDRDPSDLEELINEWETNFPGAKSESNTILEQSAPEHISRLEKFKEVETERRWDVVFNDIADAYDWLWPACTHLRVRSDRIIVDGHERFKASSWAWKLDDDKTELVKNAVDKFSVLDLNASRKKSLGHGEDGATVLESLFLLNGTLAPKCTKKKIAFAKKLAKEEAKKKYLNRQAEV